MELKNNEPKIEIFDQGKQNSGEVLYKKIILFVSVATILWTLLVFATASGAPAGSGMVSFAFLLPVLPILYIFFPLYFIVLSIKYSREKSAMHVLDKTMFYLLLPGFIFLVWILISKL